MRILLCFGTRPEAIKMAPLHHELKKTNHLVKVCVTAQHREMLDQVLDFFEIKTDFDLDLMQKGQSLNQLSSRILASIDQILIDFQPQLVVVHGDTTTSAMVALAAFHLGIKVAHVEAGLRTHNKFSPFPEELNRQLTSRIADYHFAPTAWAADNLIKEGVSPEAILVTGNTVVDALHLGLKKLAKGYDCLDLNFVKKILNPNKRLILITGHRRENFGQGFEDLCMAIYHIAMAYPEVQLVYPVHLNPMVQEPVNRILRDVANIHLMSPLDYPSFLYCMNQAFFILTDSGGVQEEAPALGKPVLLMRETTERPEALQAGTAKLVGTNHQRIVAACLNLLNDEAFYKTMSLAHSPYGDGQAAVKISTFISQIESQI